MKKEILISRESGENRVAILQDENLEEFFIERDDASKQFGNIYKGIVKSIIPGMGAAFIDLGTAKDGFLYVDDALANPFDEEMSAGEAPEKNRGRGQRLNIDEVLKQGQEIIVQVVKEGIRNKGPRLTTHFSLPARYLVLMPGDRRFGISRRVDNRSERDRIRQIFSHTELPEDAGIIVRTAGEGKSEKEFARDIKYTTQLWKKIKANIKRKKPPALIHEEFSLVERIIRDYYTEDIERIVVDDKELFKQVSKFIRLYLPGQKVELEHFKDEGAIFDSYNVNREIEKTFQQKVYLKCGAHLVIEQTEALVSIDVNTGKFTGKKNLEETVCRANIDAAREVARQLRLRDMGGVIIIDFIDMQRYENRRRVMQELWNELKNDRAKTNVLPFSDIGMVEMTRQRIRPSLESAVYDACNYCNGKAVVKSVSSMTIETFRKIRRTLKDVKHKTLEVSLHPEVASRILSQDRDAIRDFEKKSKSKVILLADSSLHREDIQIKHVN